jgi:hypothetical protein
MLSIGTAAYQNAAGLLTTDNALIRQTTPTTVATPLPSAPDTTTANKTGDRVTLSPEVDAARLRDSLGLSPTGKLKRGDFEARITSDQDGVRQAIQARIDALAPGASGTIDTLTLSQDANGRIQVTGDWSGTTELAKDLNADADFKKMFNRLAVNSGIIDYTKQISTAGNGASLMDYLDGDTETADNNLTTMLQQYGAMRTSKNSLASLINLSSNTDTPFSLTFKNSAAASR